MNTKNFWQHKSLCPLPWTGVYVNPDGRVKNCAISQETLGNIHDQPLPEILQNESNFGIRQDMLQDIRHKRCDACYRVEDNSSNPTDNESNRTWYKKVMLNHGTDFNIFDSTKYSEPMVLDLRWRNTCNQACVYCGPDLSSLWAKSIDVSYRINDEILSRSQDWIFSNLQSVRHVYLAGGEPLMIKENQRLLERLLEVTPDVEIRVNSNINHIDNPIFKLLSEFQNVKWTISVDSKEQYFEYMRWPGNWLTFLSNLSTVKNIVGDQINFNMVWCILNDIDILHTIDFLLDQGYHENMFVVQCLVDPLPLNILHLPKDHRSDLQLQIKKRQKDCNKDWWLYKSLNSMYNFLDQDVKKKTSSFHGLKPLSDGLKGTFEFLREIDRIQSKNSKEIFTRLYQYQ